MSNIKLVVFDCDGTLVDSQAAIGQSMESAFQNVGLPYPGHDTVRKMVGLSLHHAAERLLDPDQYHLTEDLIDGYRRAFSKLRENGQVHEPLYDGVLDTLEALHKQNIIMGVATGKSFRGLKATLAGHGLSDYFVTLQTSDFHPGKPHPSMLFKAMSDVGAEPENTLIIGDTTFDMEMGVNAKVKPLGVMWGYHEPHHLEKSGAAAILKSMDEVVHHALSL